MPSSVHLLFQFFFLWGGGKGLYLCNAFSIVTVCFLHFRVQFILISPISCLVMHYYSWKRNHPSSRVQSLNYWKMTFLFLEKTSSSFVPFHHLSCNPFSSYQKNLQSTQSSMVMTIQAPMLKIPLQLRALHLPTNPKMIHHVMNYLIPQFPAHLHPAKRAWEQTTRL